jgi:hypothetical protein
MYGLAHTVPYVLALDYIGSMARVTTSDLLSHVSMSPG